MKSFLARFFRTAEPAVASPTLPADWSGLFTDEQREATILRGMWQGRNAEIQAVEKGFLLRLACEADLWCRKRTSVSTMLDPTLFERYTTGDDRIDEDWIVQTNPPSAFQKDQLDGCDALWSLLSAGRVPYATRGWLNLPEADHLALPELRERFTTLQTVAATAERELRR